MCEHFIGGVRAQLLPCRFAVHIFKNDHSKRGENWELFQGITDGFDIVDQPVDGYDCANYWSITSGPAKETMDRSIKEELHEGRVSAATSDPMCIHALGAVPKATGGYRTIADCSPPSNVSVNSCSDTLAPKFKFKSIDYVVELLTENSQMAMVDIRAAYRAVTINPDHWTYQGFRWPEDGVDKLYIDHRMCFGVRTGPYYFNLISNFIHEIVTEESGLRMVNYLDDFIVICDSYSNCLVAQACLIKAIRALGFHISWHKVTPPSTVVQYLDIVMDSVHMELRLPEDKLERLRVLLCQYSVARFISKKDL